MASTPSGGERTQEEELNAILEIKVVTTDINGGCVENFEGTSSAAPLGAGCLALVLQANPLLTWRDVQHIVANGARIPGPDLMWIINGANFHVNPQFGFGMMDCTRMVELAQNWVNKPPQHVCETPTDTVSVDIPSSGCHGVQFEFDGCHGDEHRSVTHIEHIELKIKLKPVRRGNVQIAITSPAGTRSEVLRPRKKDDSDKAIDFTFMTVHSWEEHPDGEWLLEICDRPQLHSHHSTHKSAIFFESWSMRVSGYHGKNPREKGSASVPSETEMKRLAKKELMESRSIMLKRAQEVNVNVRDELNDENIDQFVDTLDNLFDTFKKTYGVRSMAEYLDEYLKADAGQNSQYSEKDDKVADKRGFTAGKQTAEVADLKHEMIDILRELTSTQAENGQSYLEAYVNRKREILQEREMEEIIERINDLLDEEEDLEE